MSRSSTNIDSVSSLTALILVITTNSYSTKDSLAFPLGRSATEEEGQDRKDGTHDGGDGH
jgi:hypothetical protein